MNRKKAIGIQSKLDIIQLVLNIIIGIVLIPYYLNFISVEIYGFWLATSGIIVLLDIFDLGISTVFTERLSKFFSVKKIKLLLDYFFSGIFLHLLISIFIVALGLILAPNLSTFFTLNLNEDIIENCFRIAVITSAFKILNNGFSILGSSILLPLNYSVTRITSLIIGIIVILKLLNMNFGLLSIAYGYLIQQLFSFLCNVLISFKLIKGLKRRFNVKIKYFILKDFISSLRYLFFARTAESIVKNIEPVIIGTSLGATSTAIYVFAKKVSDTIYQFVNIFTGATFASLININQEKSVSLNDHRIENLSKFIFYSSVILLSFYISLNKDFIELWVGNEFSVTTMLSSLIALSTFMMILIQFKTVLYFSRNRIKHVSIVLFFESIFRCILLWILFDIFDLYGGPLAIIATTAIGIFFLDKNQKINKFSLIIGLVFFCSSVYIASLNLEYLPIINIFIRGSLLTGLVLILLVISKELRLTAIRIISYISN